MNQRASTASAAGETRSATRTGEVVPAIFLVVTVARCKL